MDLIAGRTWSIERRPIRHLDPVLIFVALALSVIGLFLIYSATHASLAAQHLDLSLYVKKQVTALALGIILLLLVVTFDYRFAKVYAGIVYGALVLLLILVRTPFGTTSAGAQRWFQLAGFQFTPSEYMKLGLIIMLAAYLSEVKSQDLSLLEQVLRATVLAAIPMVLVFIQPDVGTTIVLAAILVGILVVAGARPKQLARARAHARSSFCSERSSSGREGLSAPAAHRLPRLEQRPPGSQLQQAAVGDRHRLRGNHRRRIPPWHPDEPGLHPRAAHRLHLHGRRRGVRVRRRGRDAPAVRDPDLAGVPHRDAIEGSLRNLRRRGHRLDVRYPDVRERRHDDRHHADHRDPAAVRLLRRSSLLANFPRWGCC